MYDALPLAPLAQGIAHSIPPIPRPPCGTDIESDGVLHQFRIALGKYPKRTNAISGSDTSIQAGNLPIKCLQHLLLAVHGYHMTRYSINGESDPLPYGLGRSQCT